MGLISSAYFLGLKQGNKAIFPQSVVHLIECVYKEECHRAEQTIIFDV
jgi:hypothetical protein